MRCDLCSEPSTVDHFHTYITDREVETEQESKATGKYWCEDPEWAVCPKCKPLVDADDFEGVLDRNSEYARNNSMIIAPPEFAAMMEVEMHSEAASILATFFERKRYGYGPPTDG